MDPAEALAHLTRRFSAIVQQVPGPSVADARHHVAGVAVTDQDDIRQLLELSLTTSVI
jgi:hypothetical protein